MIAIFVLLGMLAIGLALYDEFSRPRSSGRPRQQVMFQTDYTETRDNGFAG